MKMPPMNSSSTSCLISTATSAIAPPNPSDPTSPMKISAGCALYQRNPSAAPVIDPQKVVSSDVCGFLASCRYSASCTWPPAYVNTVSAPAAITINPIASPSSPSVRFTAFDMNTTISDTKTQNGSTPITYVHGLCSRESKTSEGLIDLMKGMLVSVEKLPYARISS